MRLEEVGAGRKLNDAMHPARTLLIGAQLVHGLEVRIPAEETRRIEIQVFADLLGSRRHHGVHEQGA